MRTSSIVTISLHAAMLRAAQRAAKKQHMTRSELVRTALRRYLEEMDAMEAIRVGEKELKTNKLKVLPRGGLAQLMR